MLNDKPWVLGVGITLAAVMALGFVLSNQVAGDSAGAVMATAIFAMCLGAFVAFVRHIIVFLDRPGGRVTVRVASVFGTKETGAALNDVNSHLRPGLLKAQKGLINDQHTKPAQRGLSLRGCPVPGASVG